MIPSNSTLTSGSNTNRLSLAAIALHVRICIGLREDLSDLPILEADASMLSYFLSSKKEDPCKGLFFS